MTKKTKRVSASVVRKRLTELKKEWGHSSSDIINLLRGGGTSSKGSGYERDICRRLSLWWTDDARDDIFWRSSGSGARAKVRGRSGKQTAGQHGDVAATDPDGAVFIDMFTTEIKRGYSEYTLQDMVDRAATGGIQQWENFFAQTIESYEMAGSCSWLLITRRDRRQAMVWMPATMVKHLRKAGAFVGGQPCPYVGMKAVVRCKGKADHMVDVCGMTFDDWLEAVTPESIKTLAETM